MMLFNTIPPRSAALPSGVLLLTLLLSACGSPSQAETSSDNEMASQPDAASGQKTAIFAGGCFWCVEQFFDKVDGVVSATSGYTGGDAEDPTYEQVTAGGTGHTEAVKVIYDPDQVGYDELLSVFWHNIDPTDTGGQFCDRGESYRDAIFYSNDEQQDAARASKQALKDDPDAPSPIATPIVAASEFYPAEKYHQNYYEKNPLRYKFYVTACGRYDRLDELWGEAARKP